MKRIFLGSLATTAAANVPAWGQDGRDFDRYMYGHGMMGWDGGWSMLIFGPFFMILTLVVLIGAIVLVTRWLSGSWHGPGPFAPPSNRPHDILKERFARGEIDKNEFEERLRVLGN